MNDSIKLIRFVVLLLVSLLSFQDGFSQSSVGIGTTNPNGNAVLELVSGGNNQGFLVPRLTTVQRTDTNFISNLGATDNGLMVFDSDEGKLYFWFNSQWVASNVDFGAGDGISIIGNTITNTGDTDPTDDITNTSVSNGDISGTYFNLTVGAIQGNPVAAGIPTNNQILKWDGTNWVFAADENTDNQDASLVPVVPSGSLISTDVQSALDELQGDIDLLGTTGAGSIGNDELAADAVTTGKILDGTIGNLDISNTAAIAGAKVDPDFGAQNIITTGNITGASISGTFVGDGAGLSGVTATPGVGSVGTTELIDNSVNSVKILDGTIGNLDISNTAAIAGAKVDPNFGGQDIQTTGNIVGAIITGSSFLGDGAGLTGITAVPGVGSVGTTELADNSVNSVKILDDAITNLDINVAAAIAGTKINPDFGGQDIQTTGNIVGAIVTGSSFIGDGSGLTGVISAPLPGSIGTTEIIDGAITTTKYADNSITSLKIVDGQIINADINGTAGIAGTKIVPVFGTQNIQTTGNIDGAIITGSSFIGNGSGLTGVTALPGVGSVGTTELADNSVNSVKILDDAITNLDINVAAAIAGTKIDPDFGGQNILTTGLIDGRDVGIDGLNQDALQTLSGLAAGELDIGLVSNPIVSDDQSILSAILEVGTAVDAANSSIASARFTNTDGVTILGDGDGIPLSVNANSGNIVNSIVERDGSGDFSAGDVTVDNLILSGAGVIDGRDVSLDGTNLDAVQTLTGLPGGSTNFVDLSGGIVRTNATITNALEDLEAAIESTPNPAATLSSGSIPYGDGTGILFDSPIFFDGTSNLGIGTTTPTNAKLHMYEIANQPLITTIGVNGTGASQQVGFSLMTLAAANQNYSDAGTKGWFMSARGDQFSDVSQRNDLIFSYNEGSGDVQALTLGNNGLVGIGTTTPLSDLQIKDNGHLYSEGGDVILSDNIHVAAGIPTYSENGDGLILALSSNGGFDLLHAPTGTAGLSATPTSLLAVNTSGSATLLGGFIAGSNITTAGELRSFGNIVFQENGLNKVIDVPNNTSGGNGYNLTLTSGNGDAGQNGGSIIMAPGTGVVNGSVEIEGIMLVKHTGVPNSIRFEGGPAGGSFVGLKAPGTTFTNYELTLPDGAPTAVNDVLTALDLSGTLGWTTPAAGVETGIIMDEAADRIIEIASQTSAGIPGRSLTLRAGNAHAPSGNENGGNLILEPGTRSGTGVDGIVLVEGNMSIIHDGTSPRRLDFDGGVSGGNVIGIQAPGTTFTGYGLTLPDAQGGIGEVLTNLDGSGTLGWSVAGLALPFNDSDMTDGTTFILENTFADRLTAEFFGTSISNGTAGVVIHNRDETNGSGGVLSLGITDDGGGTADGVFLVAERSAPGPSLASDFVVRTLDGAGSLTEGIRVASNSDVTFQNGNVNVVNDAFITGNLNADGGAVVNGDLTVNTGNLGVNTVTPRGNIDINGSMYLKVRTINNNETVLADDYHIFCDGSVAGAQTFTITLPPSDATQVGRTIIFSTANQGGNSTYVLDPGGATIFFSGQDVSGTLQLGNAMGTDSTLIKMTLVSPNVWIVTSKNDSV